MLQSFVGTYDSTGLRRLAIEAAPQSIAVMNNAVQFWAILDTKILPEIHRAIIRGERSDALELVSQHAISMGCQ